MRLMELPGKDADYLGQSLHLLKNDFEKHFSEGAILWKKLIEETRQPTRHFETNCQLTSGGSVKLEFYPTGTQSDSNGFALLLNPGKSGDTAAGQLLQTQEFYEEILNRIPADIAAWDTQHRYIFINHVAVKNPELRNWLINKDDFEFCSERKRDISLAIKRRDIFNRAIRNRTTEEFEEEIITPEGISETKVRIFHPVLDKSGNPKLVIGYGLDISKRKKAETELKVARRIAEESVAAKEILLANVSHELRTPLNGINGILEILMDSGLNDSQKNLVQLLQHSSLNLLNLVNDLLNLAQLRKGEISLIPEPVNFANLISNIADIFELQAKEKGLSWFFSSLIQDNLIILADKTRLTQILNNLLGNAIKFTQSGKVIFSVRITSQTEKEVHAEFRVQDSGPGIPENAENKIYEAFTRLHSKDSGMPGTGLGLNITHNLVEIHKGTIRYESTLGVGSTFIVEIPFLLPQPKESTQPESAIPTLNPQRILVIEDHPVNRFLLGNQLEVAGHIPVHVENGAEALEELEKHQFDVILLDFNLPDISGMELIQLIHQKPGFEKTPVIAVTANAFPETRIAALNAGFAEFISKPYFTDELLKKITWVKGHSET